MVRTLGLLHAVRPEASAALRRLRSRSSPRDSTQASHRPGATCPARPVPSRLNSPTDGERLRQSLGAAQSPEIQKRSPRQASGRRSGETRAGAPATHGSPEAGTLDSLPEVQQ